MYDTIEVVAPVLLISMVGIWFLLVSWLFRRLRDHHLAVYEALGSPTLFLNNSIRNNWLFLKFLLASGWRDLGDEQLAKVCGFMRVFLVAYLILFVALGGLFIFLVA